MLSFTFILAHLLTDLSTVNMEKEDDSMNDFQPDQDQLFSKFKKRCGRLEAEDAELEAKATQSQPPPRKLKPNYSWQKFNNNKYEIQCQAFEDYLASVHDTGHGVYPSGLDKDAKSNFRKVVKKYSLTNEGRLLYAPHHGPAKGM